MKLYSLLSELLLVAILLLCILALYRQPLRRGVRQLFLLTLLLLVLTACFGLLCFSGYDSLVPYYGDMLFLAKRLAMVLLVALLAWQFNARKQDMRYLILVLGGAGLINLALGLPLLTESVSVLLMALVGKQMLNYPNMGPFYLTVLSLGFMTLLPLLPALPQDQANSLFHLNLGVLVACETLLLRSYVRHHRKNPA
ncbi:hypothetical protein PVT67_02765 [Gallaecimonas kandeliae]|uniref:hypothetical protein n=1 Tax=Gallaecimonas kandeliae TaxID=3029055 RepID=UPI0026499D0E|nr:hypothetical protein [Gallaecimonas kandeliae]WKE66186.1 hypothetical protein PVT67_02765 [Gallaecimonas kandeliae]